MRRALCDAKWTADINTRPLVFTAESVAFQRVFASVVARIFDDGVSSFGYRPTAELCRSVVLHTDAVTDRTLAGVTERAAAQARVLLPPTDARIETKTPAFRGGGRCAAQQREAMTAVLRSPPQYRATELFMTHSTRTCAIADAVCLFAGSDGASVEQLPMLVCWLLSLVKYKEAVVSVPMWRDMKEWNDHAYTGMLAGLKGTTSRVLGCSPDAKSEVDSNAVLYTLYAVVLKQMRKARSSRVIDGMCEAFLEAAAARTTVSALVDNTASATALITTPTIARHRDRITSRNAKMFADADAVLARVLRELSGAQPMSSDTRDALRRGMCVQHCMKMTGGKAYIGVSKRRWGSRYTEMMTSCAFVRALLSHLHFAAFTQLQGLLQTPTTGAAKYVFMRIHGAHEWEVITTLYATVPSTRPLSGESCTVVAASHTTKPHDDYVTLLAIPADVWAAHQAVSCVSYCDDASDTSTAVAEALSNGDRFLPLPSFPTIANLWCVPRPACLHAALSVMRKWAGLPPSFDTTETTKRRTEQLRRVLSAAPAWSAASDAAPKWAVLASTVVTVPLLAVAEKEIGGLCISWEEYATAYEAAVSSGSADSVRHVQTTAASIECKAAHPRGVSSAVHAGDLYTPRNVAIQKHNGRTLGSMQSLSLTDACVPTLCCTSSGGGSVLDHVLSALECEYKGVRATAQRWATTCTRSHSDSKELMPTPAGVSPCECIRANAYPYAAVHGASGLRYLYTHDRFVVSVFDGSGPHEVGHRWLALYSKYAACTVLKTAFKRQYSPPNETEGLCSDFGDSPPLPAAALDDTSAPSTTVAVAGASPSHNNKRPPSTPSAIPARSHKAQRVQ